MDRSIRCARLVLAPRAIAVRAIAVPRGDRFAQLTPGDQFTLLTFAGIATGIVHALVIDRLIGGPGLLAAFGL